MLWDYQCLNRKCGKTSEHWDDENPMACPFCHSRRLKKIISPINVATSCKSRDASLSMIGAAGAMFAVEGAEVIGPLPMGDGEMFDLQPGKQAIISTNPRIDQGKIEVLAQAMRKKPPDSGWGT